MSIGLCNSINLSPFPFSGKKFFGLSKVVLEASLSSIGINRKSVQSLGGVIYVSVAMGVGLLKTLGTDWCC